MEDWTRLIDLNQKSIGRGVVLRIPATYPYESVVDFIVFDPSESDRGLGLLVATGHKAGLVRVLLPKESEGRENSRGIETQWLVENWKNWVYPESEVFDVFYSDHYPAPAMPMEKRSTNGV